MASEEFDYTQDEILAIWRQSDPDLPRFGTFLRVWNE
jgi:hypothetical protein